MNACQVYRDKSILIHDGSPKEIISLIIRLAQTKLKIAKTKAEVFVLEKIILNGKKLLLSLSSRLPSLDLLKQYIKSYSELLKLNISIGMKKFLMWIILMLQKANEQDKKNKEAEEAAKIAEEAAKKAAKAAASAAMKKAIKNDSLSIVKLYTDAKNIRHSLVQLRRMLLAKKYLDDKRRISTTMTPTMWEKRYVLGIKPGVTFNEKDWKAYKENGFVIVENKRTGQRYQKSQSELVAAANNEKAQKMNTVDPLIGTPGYEYGSEEPSAQQKNSIRSILKKIAITITALTGVVTAIKTLKSNASGWSTALRNFLTGTLNWLHTAKETWKEVNKAV